MKAIWHGKLWAVVWDDGNRLKLAAEPEKPMEWVDLGDPGLIVDPTDAEVEGVLGLEG